MLGDPVSRGRYEEEIGIRRSGGGLGQPGTGPSEPGFGPDDLGLVGNCRAYPWSAACCRR